MKICSGDVKFLHREIVFIRAFIDPEWCPLCEKEKEIDRLQMEIVELEKEIDDLRAQVNFLKAT